VLNCWKRFDSSFTGYENEKSAGVVTHAYNVDTNRYTDTGATDHITGELEKLTTRDKYHGHDQVHTASGSGMNIDHIGSALINTSTRELHLKNVLHVPKATKSLISVSKLASDNDAFVEYHPHDFFIKDLATKRVLLRGRYHQGLYPIPLGSSFRKQAFGVTKPSSARWHDRLGHPSRVIVQQVLQRNKLEFSRESKVSVCDSCQRAKSHQLPYPKLSSVSQFPLQLVFLDVWGPAPDSVGRMK
jgi:hypothetical protein